MTERIKDVVHSGSLTRHERVLLCLHALPDSKGKVHEIIGMAALIGLRDAAKSNVSAVLGGLKGFAINTPTGWELTGVGKSRAQALLGVPESPEVAQANTLRAEVGSIAGAEAKQFLLEAVSCLEHRLYRAAVVLSWVGAVAVLYEHVFTNCLKQFNDEASTRDPKWKQAKTTDDLARMKESSFLEILEKMSVIGKNVKLELEYCLKLRNACGHPNSLQVSESRVAAHIEILVLNVFQKY